MEAGLVLVFFCRRSLSVAAMSRLIVKNLPNGVSASHGCSVCGVIGGSAGLEMESEGTTPGETRVPGQGETPGEEGILGAVGTGVSGEIA